MALLMLISSAGVAMDFHFCQGDLQNISFFKKAKSCHEVTKKTHCEKMAKKACHDETEENLDHPKNCCDSKALVIQFDSDFAVPSLIDFDFDRSYLALDIQHFNIEELEIECYQAKDYKNYKPPSRDIDHIVSFQSFLI
jgi:hypothetical protein